MKCLPHKSAIAGLFTSFIFTFAIPHGVHASPAVGWDIGTVQENSDDTGSESVDECVSNSFAEILAALEGAGDTAVLEQLTASATPPTDNFGESDEAPLFFESDAAPLNELALADPPKKEEPPAKKPIYVKPTSQQFLEICRPLQNQLVDYQLGRFDCQDITESIVWICQNKSPKGQGDQQISVIQCANAGHTWAMVELKDGWWYYDPAAPLIVLGSDGKNSYFPLFKKVLFGRDGPIWEGIYKNGKYCKDRPDSLGKPVYPRPGPGHNGGVMRQEPWKLP